MIFFKAGTSPIDDFFYDFLPALTGLGKPLKDVADIYPTDGPMPLSNELLDSKTTFLIYLFTRPRD